MLNIDTYDEMIEAEQLRIGRIIMVEMEAFFRPEVDRQEVEQFARLSDEMKLRLPKDERQRLDKLRKRLTAEWP